MTHQLVTLEEIAQVTGRKVEDIRAECAELDMFIQSDWASRPAIIADDARGLVSGQARRTQEHRDAWNSHLQQCKEWQDARTAAVKAGADEAEAKAERRARLRGSLPGAGGALSPGARSGARYEGAIHAGAQYERRNPRPEFDGNRNAASLLYVPEAEEGSAVAAAVGTLRRPVTRKSATEIEVQ